MEKKVYHCKSIRQARQKTHVSSINPLMCVEHFSVKEAKLLERFAEFKLGYINSVIYDYKPSKVLKQGKTSLKSVGVIEYTVNKFIELKWAKIENGDLVLTSAKELRAIYSCSHKLKRISIEVEPNKTRTVFQTIALSILQRKRDYVHNVNNTLRKLSKYDKKFIHSCHRFRMFSGVICTLSYGYVSKATKVASTSCKRVIKRLERSGMLRTNREKRVCIGKMSISSFNAIKSLNYYLDKYKVANLYLHKGYLFYTPNNAYLLFPQHL